MCPLLNRLTRRTWGKTYCGDSLDLLEELLDNSINLVMTRSALRVARKKEYGNKEQHEYMNLVIRVCKTYLTKATLGR